MTDTGRSSEMQVVHGINAVKSMLRRGPERIEVVYLLDGLGAKRLGRLTEALDTASVKTMRCDEAHLEQLLGTSKHQGVAALVHPLAPLDERQARQYVASLARPLILVLDSVQDPRNFGACLRTANAAGADLVVTARNRNVGFTPAVSKAASGAAELQRTASVGNLARFLDFLKERGVWLIGTDAAASRTLFQADLTAPVAMVLGSEGTGLRRLTRDRCDQLVRLPMLGEVESLNVSVAAGVCLYECRRQRDG